MSESDSQTPSGREPPKPKGPSGEETARVLQEVIRDQAERKARQQQGTSRKDKKRLLPLPVVALLWGVACLFVWAATPEFLLPEPLPEPTPAQVETGLRMEMISLVTEIGAYRDQTGRVPETLDRIVEDPPAGIRYTALSGDAYRLTGVRGDQEIVYQSGDPVNALVGDVRDQIRGQGGGGSSP